MAPKEDGRSEQDESKEQPDIILGGLSRIIKTSLLIPLDVVQMRLRYPDTWCVKMFRIMVHCKGCPGPYEVLSAGMLQKRIFDSLRWGIYYCLYEAHKNFVVSKLHCFFKRSCLKKGFEPLCKATFLLKGRPIVMHVIEQGAGVEVLDYIYERRRIRERKLVHEWLEVLTTRVHSALQLGLIQAFGQDWNFDALGAVMTPTHREPRYGRTFPGYCIKVALGGVSGVLASTLLHPLDVFKVRLQLYPEVWGLSLLRNMLRCEGFRAPYTGLTASILRQATYTTSRLGTYYCLYENYRRKYNGPPGFYEKLAFGMYSGIVGAFVGCPSEVILVRMMADGPVDPYRRYKGIIEATTKICQTEGIGSLWRGAILTMCRSVVISVSQIGTYTQARNYLAENQKSQGFLLNLYTSMLSSFVTAVATLPLDTFKTRFQVASNGNHRDVYQKFRQDSGVLGLWRGFTPYYMRLSVHTLVTFYLLEMLYESHRTRLKKQKIQTEKVFK